MNRIYLCGHTGSANRGCDAILRSTALLLGKQGFSDISALTFDNAFDKCMGLDSLMELIPYPSKSFCLRAAARLHRTLLHDGVWGNRCLYQPLFKQVTSDDIIFNVGGDTYCYSTPYLSYALNEMAFAKGIPTVFWGCSVDERIIHDVAMQKDINRYTYIVARETLSYDMISRCVSDKEKVLLSCDPAFTLPPQAAAFPDGFIPGNTVGINLSPLVLCSKADTQDLMYQNVVILIRHILTDTDMNVCLIPHVFRTEKDSQDLSVLRSLYSQFQGQNRISIVEEAYNSAQLKFIISQCRFFIGARTHAVIAAYSSSVPALALSYSIKSLGIAKDIFGTFEDYTLARKNLKTQYTLTEAFDHTLLARENDIRAKYAQVLPTYVQRILDVTKIILK